MQPYTTMHEKAMSQNDPGFVTSMIGRYEHVDTTAGIRRQTSACCYALGIPDINLQLPTTVE